MRKKRLLIGAPTLIFLVWMLISDRSGVGLITIFAAILHECGHILAAKLMRIPLRELKLDLLGARLEVSGRILSYGEEWLLAAAGPFSSLVFALVASPLWNSVPLSITFSCASLLLGLLNLLPIRTFDGGRMIDSMLTAWLGESKSYRIMKGCSFLFLFLLWAIAVYFLLRANDGLSLLCFSMSLLGRFFDSEK